MLKTLIRDPLLHFLIIGIGLYALVDTVSPSSRNELRNVVSVSQSDLITLMQQADQNYNQALYQQKFEALTEPQKAALVDQFAEQEILFREAESLGLDKNDDVYRRRLIQKMRYFLEGFAQSSPTVSEAQIQKYFADHQDSYVVPAQASFTHVFYKIDSSRPSDTFNTASEALLPESGAIPAGGDYFPYHKNYLAKTESQLTRHFGANFAAEIFKLEADPDHWQGPLQSAYGAHLVKITSRQNAYLPELDSVKSRVLEDAHRALLNESKKAQIEQLKSQYQIVVTDSEQ